LVMMVEGISLEKSKRRKRYFINNLQVWFLIKTLENTRVTGDKLSTLLHANRQS
jgi:hypothetical protein